MGKIIKLKDVSKYVKPNTSTLVGGVFDLFHVGHLRYLKECAKHGRPLVVIIQSDKTVGYRKGFNRPIISQNRRAEIISHLNFVDFVLILDKPSHYNKYLEKIKPRTFVFSRENVKYRLNRKDIIKKQIPNLKVIFLPKNVRSSGTSFIVKKVLSKRNYLQIKNPIRRRLYFLADKCESNIGKVSALITHKDEIIAESNNNDKKNLHAEIIVINKTKNKDISLKECKLFVSIPPCIMCAKVILKNKIPEVYYLNPYGNDDGIKLLRQNKIKVKRYK